MNPPGSFLKGDLLPQRFKIPTKPNVLVVDSSALKIPSKCVLFVSQCPQPLITESTPRLPKIWRYREQIFPGSHPHVFLISNTWMSFFHCSQDIRFSGFVNPNLCQVNQPSICLYRAYTSYEGPKLGNQRSRMLGVFNQKLGESHSSLIGLFIII